MQVVSADTLTHAKQLKVAADLKSEHKDVLKTIRDTKALDDDTAAEIRRLRPALPVVIVSGFVDAAVATKARAADESTMLLLIAFGLSSFVIQQKDASHHAAEQSNRPVGVSAYLA